MKSYFTGVGVDTWSLIYWCRCRYMKCYFTGVGVDTWSVVLLV